MTDRIAKDSVDLAPESRVVKRDGPDASIFAYAIGVTRAYAHRLQTHSCDETCHCCAQCYQLPGIEICDRLCPHADGGDL